VEQTYSSTQNFHPSVTGTGFVLLMEGAIPDDDFCHCGDLCNIGSESLRDQLVELCTRSGAKAGAVVSIGTCSSFGGIPAARGNLTGAQSMSAFLTSQGITTPVVNVPGCPPHPDWMVGTILTYLTDPMNLINNLNSDGAPRDYFAEYQCNAGPCTWRYNNSSTRPDHDSTWVEGDSKGLAKYKWTGTDVGCIGTLGCKGRKTKADCSARKWNAVDAATYGNEMSWCVGSRGGCHGCTNPLFPDGVGKFFTIR
jgi:hydrogenase small subunit